jgi:hypothetical protein
MRSVSKYLALLAAVISIVAFANAMPIQQENPQESIVEGSLVQLDSTARLLVLKAADKEMQFSFNEQTQVVGPEKDGKPVQVRQGSKLKIHYKVNQNTNMATRIEVTEP